MPRNIGRLTPLSDKSEAEKFTETGQMYEVFVFSKRRIAMNKILSFSMILILASYLAIGNGTVKASSIRNGAVEDIAIDQSAVANVDFCLASSAPAIEENTTVAVVEDRQEEKGLEPVDEVATFYEKQEENDSWHVEGQCESTVALVETTEAKDERLEERTLLASETADMTEGSVTAENQSIYVVERDATSEYVSPTIAPTTISQEANEKMQNTLEVTNFDTVSLQKREIGELVLVEEPPLPVSRFVTVTLGAIQEEQESSVSLHSQKRLGTTSNEESLEEISDNDALNEEMSDKKMVEETMSDDESVDSELVILDDTLPMAAVEPSAVTYEGEPSTEPGTSFVLENVEQLVEAAQIWLVIGLA